MVSFYSLLLLLCTAVLVPVSAYQDFIYIQPPTNMSNLPVIRIGTTFSLAGANSATGTYNSESIKMCIDYANKRGGVWMNNQQYALGLQYLSDDSSADYAYTVYQGMANQVVNTLNQAQAFATNSTPPALLPSKSTQPLHLLLAPHLSSMTLPALQAVREKNVTLFAVGASSPAVYTYPYVWGNAALSFDWMTTPLNHILGITANGGIKTAIIIVKASETFSAGVYTSTVSRLQAAGVNIQYVGWIPPSQPATASTFQSFMTDLFQNSSCPRSPDLMLLITNTITELAPVTTVMSQVGMNPGLAVFTQYYDESAASLSNYDGWVGTFTWRPDVNIKTSSLPGSPLFTDNNDFQRVMSSYYPTETINPSHAQEVGSFEGLLAAINLTTDFTSPSIRAANLRIDGYTFFAKLKYDPNTGANPSEELLACQIQNKKSKCIASPSDFVFPTVWSWMVQPPKVVYSQTGGQLGIMILALIFIAALLCISALFFRWKKGRVIHASAPLMMAATLVGAALVYVAAILQLVPPNTVNCTLSLWFFNVGFTMALGSLFLKSLRLHVIFNSKKLKVSNLSDGKLLVALAGLVLIDCTLLAIHTGVSPYSDLPSVQMCQLKNSGGGSTDQLESDIVTGILIGVKGLLLLIGTIVCFKVRQLPSLYNESSFLAAAIYNTVVFSIVWLGIRFAFDFNSTPISLTIFEATIMIIGTSVTIGLMFIPKFVIILRSGEHNVKIKHIKRGIKMQMAQNQSVLSSSHSSDKKNSKGIQPHGGGTGTTANLSPATLPVVKNALQQLRDLLETNSQKLLNELQMLHVKLTEKKRALNSLHQEIATVQAEQEYVDEYGSQMDGSQLKSLLDEKSSQRMSLEAGTGAAQNGAQWPATAYVSKLTSGMPAPPVTSAGPRVSITMSPAGQSSRVISTGPPGSLQSTPLPVFRKPGIVSTTNGAVTNGTANGRDSVAGAVIASVPVGSPTDGLYDNSHINITPSAAHSEQASETPASTKRVRLHFVNQTQHALFMQPDPKENGSS